MDETEDKEKFKTVSIRKYFEFKDPKEGEDMLRDILSSYSCPINFDVEHFLKEQATVFTKKNQSVTYLVFLNENVEFLGYFTLTIKPITIKPNSLLLINSVMPLKE